MKRILIVIACMLALCALLPVAAADAGSLVQIPEARLPLARSLGVELEPACEDVYLVRTDRELAILRSAGLVAYAEPNEAMELDVNSWNVEAIHADSAWTHQDASGDYDRRGDGVTVAIVDSGVDSSHGDLNADRILPYKDYGSNENGVDIWHGTFVAGIIAARLDNGTGIDGLAPDVTLLPVTITSGGTSDTFTAIRGIEYAANHGADVINLSIGGDSDSLFLERTCRNAAKSGAILVAAAGNYKTGETPSEKNIVYPAGYDCVVGVSGCRQTVDGPVFDSDYSYFNSKVDVCAPGSKIRSLYLSGGTAVASGTSFAAPSVSAMAAIAKQTNPAIGVETFLRLLEATSTDLGDEGRDIYYGMGFVDMASFLALLDTSYTINYISDGQPASFEAEVQTSYTIADPEIPLPVPVRRGSRFLGWYENAELTGSPVQAIPTASMGERTFYAKWEALPNAAPAVRADAPSEADAVPASLDGRTPTRPFTADVSAWFDDPDGDPLRFSLIAGPGALDGTALRYAPAAEDAGTGASITVRADDGCGHTAQHTVTVRVGPVPASQPVLKDPDGAPLELTESPSELGMELILYDSTVTGVRLGQTPLEWRMEGERLVVSLPALEAGLYELTVEFDAGDPCTRTLRVAPTQYVSVLPEAPKDATAKPASLDGVTSATPYHADVSTWFSEPQGKPLTYEIAEGPGTLLDTGLDYIPSPDDAMTDVPITVRADDSLGHSAEHTVTVHVQARPASQPVLEDPDDAISLDLCVAYPDVSVDLRLYDSQITGVRIGQTPLRWKLRGRTLSVSVPPLTAGDYDVLIECSPGDPIVWPWHVYYSVQGPKTSEEAPAEAEAAPASADGSIPALPFAADVSTWFTGDALTYALVSGPGALEGSALTFLPEAGNEEVSITVRASDVYGQSAEHTVLVHVGPSPAAQPALTSGDLDLLLCDDPQHAEGTLMLKGAELLSVRLDAETELTWQLAGDRLRVDVPALEPGDYTLRLEFDQGAPVLWIWHVRECPSAAFTDVARGVWYHSAVDWTVAHQLMVGVASDRFDPDGSFTRAMLVTVLYRAAGSPEAPEDCPFRDVEPNRWYTDAVAWAAETGIVNGMSPDRFAPDAPITREQLVTILFRYAGDDGTRTDLSAFPDAGAVSQYARDAMSWAVGRGIVNGVGSADGSTLSPRDGASRAQVAAIVMRYLTADNATEVTP